MRTTRSRRRVAVRALVLILLALLAAAVLDASATAPGTTQAHPARATSTSSDGQAARASAVRFDVTGDVTGLVPDAWREIPVRVANPTGVPIRVTGVTLAVGPDSTPPGCSTTTNLEVRQPLFTAGSVLTLAPRATVTLPAGGVSTAAVRLRDLPGVNQDVCKHKSFTLLWSGTAEQ